jgi:putative ABC transport system permease protein
VAEGRFFAQDEDDRAAPVCVLGEGAKSNLFGYDDALGKYLKVNGQWYRVIGVVGPQISAQTEMAGIPTQDRNNLITFRSTAIFRTEDN